MVYDAALIAIDTHEWAIPLSVASVPAVASIVAAFIAARSARLSRASEMEATRLRALEERLAGHRYEMYKPMIDLLRRVLDSSKTGVTVADKEFTRRVSEFGAWISIFGSDDALRAFHNFMQGAYHNAPAPVAMRLYAEFLLAARKDMGDPSTAATPSQVLGIRINDIYDDPNNQEIASLSFDALCERHGWTTPWPTPAQKS